MDKPDLVFPDDKLKDFRDSILKQRALGDQSLHLDAWEALLYRLDTAEEYIECGDLRREGPEYETWRKATGKTV